MKKYYVKIPISIDLIINYSLIKCSYNQGAMTKLVIDKVPN